MITICMLVIKKKQVWKKALSQIVSQMNYSFKVGFPHVKYLFSGSFLGLGNKTIQGPLGKSRGGYVIFP